MECEHHEHGVHPKTDGEDMETYCGGEIAPTIDFIELRFPLTNIGCMG